MKKSLILLVIILSAVWLSGCGKIVFSTGFDDDTVMKISGEKIAKSEAELMLLVEKYEYESSFGIDIWDETMDGMSMEDYVKYNVKEKLFTTETKCLLADSEKISLTEEETQEAYQSAEIYFEECGEFDLESYKELFVKYALADKVYGSIVDSVDIEVSDADTKVIEVQYIYFDISADESHQRAEEALEKVENGYDFESVANEYSDDDEIDYVFGKGQTYEEFQDAAYALTDNEVSGIVETVNGYYIIKCIEDYMIDETEQNRKEIIYNLQSEAFDEVYIPFMEDLVIEFNDDMWEDLKI